jgi:hypothetical protein
MFAVRRLTRALAMDVVARCVENSVANDVEWPLFAAASGYSAAYFASDYLMYRTREDFDAVGDRHDNDPLRWISRVEIADLHVQAMKRYAAPAR